MSYDDILDLPHHVSSKHPRMPVAERAAQFSPFAALSGYDDVIAEAGRLTDERIDLADEEKLAIGAAIQNSAGSSVVLTYFIRDERKNGGCYDEAEGTIKRIDEAGGLIVLEDGRKIRIEDIISVKKSCRSSATAL